MPVDEAVIENQFFIGVPWKDIRPKFENAISALREEYPVHCLIFGRNTGQDADDLWHSIQREIRATAATVFDVSGSNPNVALEFGYAEALGKQRVLTRYERKTRKKQPASPHQSSIISDLAGKIRVPYKNVNALKAALRKEFDRNPYAVRFKAFVAQNRLGKRQQKVAIAAVHELSGGKRVRKPTLVLNLKTAFPNVTTVDIPALLDHMADAQLLVIKRGPHGGVWVPKVK